MNFKNDNGIVTIFLSGKVDSANAPALEKEIWDNIDFKSCNSITLDAENLDMISSAGLRIILKMRKLCRDFKIIGVNSEVYEVLDMTGFSEMMKVEKAYRKLSVDGCTILGQGSNGVVYRYDPEIVVKVYRNADALAEIERERKLARRALVSGIPTAIPFDIVKVGNSYGSVFELLNAKLMSEMMAEEPEKIDDYIVMFADLLKKMHSTEAPRDELSDIKKVALGWAEFLKNHLPTEQGEKLIKLISDVPDRATMIHGDYHTNNVELQDGEILLIDMDTLSFGHPVFEFASMFLGFVGFGELDHACVEKFLKLPYSKTLYIWRKTLELYFDTTDDAFLRKIEDKARVVGYARLLRRTIKRIGYDDPTGKATIEHCKKQLSELLEKVDSLEF